MFHFSHLLTVSLVALRVLAAPRSSHIPSRLERRSPPLPTEWSGVMLSDPQDVYTGINGTIVLPLLVQGEKGSVTSASAWIGIDAQNCSSSILGGIDMTLQADGITMTYFAWGWLYPNAPGKVQAVEAIDGTYPNLDLNQTDRVDLSLDVSEHHTFTVTNQRNGVTLQVPFGTGPEGGPFCQHNVGWMVGRTDANSPARFGGSRFDFTNNVAFTQLRGSVNLHGAAPAGKLESAVKCSVEATATNVTCIDS